MFEPRDKQGFLDYLKEHHSKGAIKVSTLDFYRA
jgi:hypothetical protein